MTNERALIRFTALRNLVEKLHDDCKEPIVKNHVLMSKFLHLRHLVNAFGMEMIDWSKELLLGKVAPSEAIEQLWHYTHIDLFTISARLEDAAYKLKFDMLKMMDNVTTQKKDVPEELWN